jgi:hypothetical protein
MLLSCIIRNNYCKLLRNIRREKTLGEMGTAVIRTINNLLRTAWLRTQAPNGDKARVSRCSEGDHEGHLREVPQEERSPSMYIVFKSCTFRKEEFQSYYQLQCKYYWKTNIQGHSGCVMMYIHKLTSKHPLPAFLMYKICHTITGVYT